MKFHELRHTQATQLLSNGVDVKTVQTRLGHASPSITLGWYAHAIPQNDQAAAQMLGNLFSAPSIGDDQAKQPAAAKTQSQSKVTAKSRREPRPQQKKTGQLAVMAS
ncbi:tyrosine-type recombinase/integrase [Olsenella phocaeensis]|uniref:tyrosine-type recombinase/integrase n=1 Tax=Olsenella phocaeensis TaxID=1852385 RepID=UPI003A91CEFA